MAAGLDVRVARLPPENVKSYSPYFGLVKGMACLVAHLTNVYF